MKYFYFQKEYWYYKEKAVFYIMYKKEFLKSKKWVQNKKKVEKYEIEPVTVLYNWAKTQAHLKISYKYF